MLIAPRLAFASSDADLYSSSQISLSAFSIDFQDATSQAVGAWDFTRGFAGLRPHREWEATHLLPRPVNVFPLDNGFGLGFKEQLEHARSLNPDEAVGVRLSLYGSGGVGRAALTWGPTPPYRSNPLVGNSETLGFDGAWYQDNSRSLWAAWGSLSPLYVSDAAIKGQPNPTAAGPTYLPFYGLQVARRFYNPFSVPKWMYEAVGVRLADGSPYSTRLYGAYLGRDTRRSRIGLTAALAQNQGAATGLTPAPAQGSGLGWATPGGLVGPQRQIAAALDANYTFHLNGNVSRAFGVLGLSSYQSQAGIAPQVSGSLVSLGGITKVSGTDLSLEYLTVGARYDPFILPTPSAALLGSPPMFGELPYATTYPGGYFLHDTKKYPHDRAGFRIQLDRPIVGERSFGQLTLVYGDLWQRELSTAANLTGPGFIEPLFAAGIPGGSTQRGRITHLGGQLAYNLHHNRQLRLALHNYQIRRPSADANRIALGANFTEITYAYPLKYRANEKTYLETGLSYVAARGAFLSAGQNADLRQTGLNIALTYSLSRPPDEQRLVAIRYRLLRQDDRATPLVFGDFVAHQITVEATLDF